MAARRPLVVIGAGGFGRRVVDLARAVDDGEAFDLVGLVDDGAPDLALLERMGTRWLGPVAAVAELPRETAYVVAVGDPGTRRRLVGVADSAGLEPVPLVHPSVVVGSLVDVGPGTMVCDASVLVTHVSLGAHVVVNTGTILGHDAVLEDFVSLMLGVRVGGGAVLEHDVYVGTAGVVLPRLRVGAGAVVGAAACVVHDVEPGVTVLGVPARPVRRGEDGEGTT